MRQATNTPPTSPPDALRGLLGCGDLASGFARFQCGGCGTDRLVALCDTTARRVRRLLIRGGHSKVLRCAAQRQD